MEYYWREHAIKTGCILSIIGILAQLINKDFEHINFSGSLFIRSINIEEDMQ